MRAMCLEILHVRFRSARKSPNFQAKIFLSSGSLTWLKMTKSSFKIQKLKGYNLKELLPVLLKLSNTDDKIIGNGTKPNSINWFMIWYRDSVPCIKRKFVITISDPTIYFIVLQINVMWLVTFHMQLKKLQ